MMHQVNEIPFVNTFRLLEQFHWVEVCFCPTPLAEERAYWEEYFELLSVKDAHARRNCRDWNGTESWACCECDCTRRLEAKLRSLGQPFIESLNQTLRD